ALVEASHEKIGSPVDEMILYCFQYSARTGKYDVVISHVLVLGGGFTLLLLGGLLLVLMRGGRRHGAAAQARLAGAAAEDLAAEAQKRSS
ncbi:MAG: hypothetical protein ACRD18_01635, partial [Terriglobia bacterium]